MCRVKGMSRRWAVCLGTGGMAWVAGGFGRQVFEDAFDQLLCLFAVEVADDGDDGVVFAVVGAVEGADVVQTNLFKGCRRLCFAPLP